MAKCEEINIQIRVQIFEVINIKKKWWQFWVKKEKLIPFSFNQLEELNEK